MSSRWALGEPSGQTRGDLAYGPAQQAHVWRGTDPLRQEALNAGQVFKLVIGTIGTKPIQQLLNYCDALVIAVDHFFCSREEITTAKSSTSNPLP
jgi:hypothetical protein